MDDFIKLFFKFNPISPGIYATLGAYSYNNDKHLGEINQENTVQY